MHCRQFILKEDWNWLKKVYRFFDLRRWDNGTGSMAATINAYKEAEVNRPSLYALNPTATFDKGKDEYYPLPQVAD